MRFEPGNSYGKHNNHRNGVVSIPKEVKDQIVKDTPLYFERLKQFALGPDKKIATAAINEILSRVYGQPKQYVETDIVQEHNVNAEFAGLLKDIASRVSGKSAEPSAGTAEDMQPSSLPE